MVVQLGQMQLPAPQDPDPSDDYFNGTISGGGLWTALTRASDHDHTGGVNGKPISVAGIPDGSITTAKLDPSVLLPYALVDGSKPFTGTVTMNADQLIRDTLRFGAKPAGVADATLARTGAGALRVDTHLGVGVNPAAWRSDLRALQVGPGATVMGDTGGAVYLTSNNYYDAVGPKALITGASAQAQLTSGALVVATAPSVAAGAAQTFTIRLTLDQAGNLGVGVTPAAVSGYTLLQTPSLTLQGAGAGVQGMLMHNSHFDGGAWKAAVAGAGIRFLLQGGDTTIATAPSVAAGAAQTFTPRFALAPTGTLTLTPDAGQAHVASGAGTALILSGISVSMQTGAGGSVQPAVDNTTQLGGPAARYTTLYATTGTINTSSQESKEGITPLDPARAMQAVRDTPAVTFDYVAPTRGPEWYDLPDDPEQAEAVLQQRLTAAPLEAAARHQAGFIAEAADPLFLVGERQTSPGNSVGILLAALQQLDARVAQLEGAA